MSAVSIVEAKLLNLISFARAQSWYQRFEQIFTRLLLPFFGPKESKLLVKYGLVGTMGMLIELTTLNILIFALGWSGDFEKLAANVVAVGLAIASNFVWNRLWTFPGARHQNKRVQFFQFAAVSLVGLTLNSTAFFAIDQFLLSLSIPQLYAIQIAKLAAILIVFFWNFAVNRLWTFRDKTATPDRDSATVSRR